MIRNTNQNGVNFSNRISRSPVKYERGLTYGYERNISRGRYSNALKPSNFDTRNAANGKKINGDKNSAKNTISSTKKKDSPIMGPIINRGKTFGVDIKNLNKKK